MERLGRLLQVACYRSVCSGRTGSKPVQGGVSHAAPPGHKKTLALPRRHSIAS